jgi:hypothetical protein
MKKTFAVCALALAFAMGALATKVYAQVHDWHDLNKVHDHVVEAIHEMDNARAANHYDMAGHGAKAEEHLHAAERELSMAIDAMRSGR